MKIFWPLVLVFVCCMFVGCGASTGTGLDSTEQANSNKIVQISEVLAVDDLLIGSTLHVGTGVQDGKLTGVLQSGARITGQDGKISSFSVSVSSNTSYLYFQVTGGKNGPNGPELGNNSRFFGVLEFQANSEQHLQNRVNVNPFSTLTTFAKAKNPGRKVSDLALSIASPFFSTTATAGIDINSVNYAGLTSKEVEPDGDGAFLQIMNEMIRVAAEGQAGDSIADKISNFCQIAETEFEPNQDVFSEQGVLFGSLSSISTQLATSPTRFGNFFSEAISYLSTSDASFKPSAYATGVASVAHITVGTQVMLSGLPTYITSISNGIALITSADGASVILTSIPHKIVLDLSHNQFQAPLQGVMTFLAKRAPDDLLEASIDPVHIDSRNPFTLTFPSGSVIRGNQQSPDGTSLQVTALNQSEDQFVSTTGFMEIPIGELLSKAESVSGTIFPESIAQTLEIEVRVEQMSGFRVKGFEPTVKGFSIKYLQIIP